MLNQCGYEVTASSEQTNNPGHLAFNNLTTPIADRWIAGPNKYDGTTGSYVTTGSYARLSTDFPSSGTNPQTAAGEYIMIRLPDRRKLVAYKLTREDGTFYQFSPQDFTLYARETNTSDWVNLTSESLTTTTIMGNASTGGGTRYPSTGDLTPTTAYQYYAVVVTAIWPSNHQTFALSEFELFCQPASIENFKLYGSPDNSSWTLIHDQNTSANITSSGTDFTITNAGSYQHYGLVVTKNGGFHNVSLAEMKLGVSDTVDLSDYYNKTEVNSLLPKGVWAEASVVYTSNSSSSYSATQLAVSAVGGQHQLSPGVLVGTFATSHWGFPSYWASAPEAHRWAFTHYFNSAYVDDTGQESSEYKIVLTKTNITLYDIFVIQKQPDWCVIAVLTMCDPANYHIVDFSYDIMVF